MPVTPARRRPAYAISSVDNALRLLQMLRDVGAVRGKEAAEELGISPSSVHRLMAMLVFRGFAVQDESRAYLPGPAIGVPPAGFDRTRRLQQLARPYLNDLRDTIDETTNLSILVKTSVRFIYTAESRRPPQGDRFGFVLPAHTSAAGRAMLAHRRQTDLATRYRAVRPGERDILEGDELRRLQAQLMRVREVGYALSVEENEAGIASVAVPLRIPGKPAAAVSLATGAIRRARLTEPHVLECLFRTREAIENAMALESASVALTE